MSLLDNLAGGLMGGGGDSPVSAVLEMVQKYPGGIAGLVSAFQDKGLGEVAASWVGTGANLPVSASQIQSVLGDGPLADIASKLGGNAGGRRPDAGGQRAQATGQAASAAVRLGRILRRAAAGGAAPGSHPRQAAALCARPVCGGAAGEGNGAVGRAPGPSPGRTRSAQRHGGGGRTAAAGLPQAGADSAAVLDWLARQRQEHALRAEVALAELVRLPAPWNRRSA